MSSASTVGLPYSNIIILNLTTPPAGIAPGANFLYTIDDTPILSGTYLASLYINIVQEGGDTTLGTVITQIVNVNGDITNSFAFTTNYFGETQFIDMEAVPCKIQNTQMITINGPTAVSIIGNILFQNTPPTATGYLLLKAI
jgi:hypothetical protein